ncbi:hypothetical protein LOD99_2848 [Oopsacas minuta]|uniref:Uncharacterized protein n=1 Tax=Oopsacas minuta TaxID=111878 RepID=A0AAV7K329_9METZ|nr:hypothetical protein LOD99_2848 [Oopsacas minuta]
MSFNILVTQTISCFEEVLRFINTIPDSNKEQKYLSSLVKNLIEEWKQQKDDNNKNRRQMSEHVGCSKKNFEETLERVRRNSKIESTKVVKKELPVIAPVKSADIQIKDPEQYLAVPQELPPRAPSRFPPTLPPRNNLTQGNVHKEAGMKRKDLKVSNSCCELGVNLNSMSRIKNTNIQQEPNKTSLEPTKTSLEPKDSDTLTRSYDINLNNNPMDWLPTPEPLNRKISPLSSSEDNLSIDVPKMKPTGSCSDILRLSNEDLTGESTLLSNSLRSSHVKFKSKSGKYTQMYITLVGKNMYVSRNYADDQSELIYSLDDYEIVPKDEGRSKNLIQLWSNNIVQCTICIKSADIRDDWYKSMIRSKYKPKTKSPLGSVEVPPLEPPPASERAKIKDRGIYVSANRVDPTAARDLGIKVVIREQDELRNDNEVESEYLELQSNEGVSRDNHKVFEHPYLSATTNFPLQYPVNDSETCKESDYFLVPNKYFQNNS